MKNRKVKKGDDMGLFKKLYLAFVLVFLLVMSFCFNSHAGIMVSPGAFTMQNAGIGKDMDLGIDLIITNSSRVEQVFTARSIVPSQATKWLKGYGEIPDASWFYFPEDKIKIKANGTGKLRMHLKIPAEEKYLNQHWIVFVEVTTLAEEGTMFKMSVRPNYMIETKSEADIKVRPYGALGLVPSMVKAGDVIAGKNRKANFKVYNNDSVSHTYQIASYIPNASSAKQDISVSPGYEWVKEISWVRPTETQIKLNPGEVKDVHLNIRIPEGSNYSDQGWESVVFVEPDKGLSGFVRVLIEGEK